MANKCLLKLLDQSCPFRPFWGNFTSFMFRTYWPIALFSPDLESGHQAVNDFLCTCVLSATQYSSNVYEGHWSSLQSHWPSEQPGNRSEWEGKAYIRTQLNLLQDVGLTFCSLVWKTLKGPLLLRKCLAGESPCLLPSFVSCLLLL